MACGDREQEMATRGLICWRQQSPDLHEAVLRAADGRAVYVGYVARTPPRAVWRGYVGPSFAPVGMGPLEIMKAAVEQRVRDAGLTETAGRGERGERGETTRG